MSDPKHSSPAPKGQPEEKAAEKPPAYVPPPTQEKRQRSVVHYIAILFAAAFLLMLMTYLMDRRQNEEVVDSLNQSVSGLRESISNMQSVQEIYEENQALLEKIDHLEDQVDALERQSNTQAAELEQAEQTRQAMDWFWQIDEAYVLGRYSLCRDLIQTLEDSGLAADLPQESITDNGRFSPALRYQEIREALY
ncbi:MAG: hypothetical protein ACOX7A_07720 [Lawsonibacter sp.]